MAKGGWEKIDEAAGVWRWEYSFGPGLANCVAVRGADDQVVVLSPACGLDAAAYDAVAELGEVRALVAPNAFHHLGLPGWSERFPKATIHCTEPAAKRIRKQHRGLGALAPLEQLDPILGERVRVFAAPHMRSPDTLAIVDTDDGAIWFTNDVLGNTQKLPKNPVLGFLFRVSKSGPGYMVNRLALRFLGADRPALMRRLLEDLERHAPKVVVPGHGPAATGADLPERTRVAFEAAL